MGSATARELDPGASRLAAQVSFDHPAAQATFDGYLRALEAAEERARTPQQERLACAEGDDYREAVGLLRYSAGGRVSVVAGAL